MRRLLSSMAVVAGLCAAPAYGQLILAEPGQVVAGKTLLSASQPDLGDNNELIFIGEFDEAPEDDVVDLRQGVFMLNVDTKAAQLLAWTGQTELAGTRITEISSPKINQFSEVLYRVATPSLSAVMNEEGAIVAQQGTEIAPGLILGDIRAIALNRGDKLVIDDSAIYDIVIDSLVAELPLQIAGKTATAPRYIDLSDSSGAAFTDGDFVFRWLPPGSSGNVSVAPGDVIDGHEITRGVSMALALSGKYAIVAALADGSLGLFQDGKLVLQEGEHFGNKVISGIQPDIGLNDAGRLVFSASLDGKQSILMVPEPSAMALALMAVAVVARSMLRRLSR